MSGKLIAWLKRRAQHALAMLEDLLAPRGMKCLCCDNASEGMRLCPECSDKLNELRLPMREGDIQHAWAYRGIAKQLVMALKYDCSADSGMQMAQGMAEVAERMSLPADVILTWVPMPDGRRRARGIDHGRLLCERTAELLGLEAKQFLVRKRNSPTQRSLNGFMRRLNLKHAFSCAQRCNGSILLIDDVYTTGTTTHECAEALKRSGADRVFVLTATRVLRDKS